MTSAGFHMSGQMFCQFSQTLLGKKTGACLADRTPLIDFKSHSQTAKRCVTPLKSPQCFGYTFSSEAEKNSIYFLQFIQHFNLRRSIQKIYRVNSDFNTTVVKMDTMTFGVISHVLYYLNQMSEERLSNQHHKLQKQQSLSLSDRTLSKRFSSNTH